MKTIYDRIYRKLNEIGVLDIKETTSITLKSGGFMDLHVDRLAENCYSLTHYYKSGGDLIPDPDMEILVHREMGMAEATSYQDTYGYRRVYLGEDKVDLSAKKELNSFLNQWLTNLINQGFKNKNSEK